MIDFESTSLESRFSKTTIDRQLQKIVHDPIFADSDILKRFLTYVVEETLNEHANRLKEYTIAVNVLEKPSNFKPQESGIVRIHAGRLRRALNYYYSGRGILDAIRISIPKGSYVPVFSDNNEQPGLPTRNSGRSAVVGVAPFTFTPKNNLWDSFAEGMGAQLETALMHIENLSVVSQFAMRQIFAKEASTEGIGVSGVQYLITGNIQALKGSVRMHLQMSRVRTGQLVWSQMYERKYTAEHLFEVQDEIVKLVVSELEGLAF
jgi:TolB-like protein